MGLKVKERLRRIFLDPPVDRVSIESDRTMEDSIRQAKPTTPEHLARCIQGLMVVQRRHRNFNGGPTLEERLMELMGGGIQPILGAAIRLGILKNLFTVSVLPEDFSEIPRSSEKEDLPFFLGKSDEELAALARDPSADFSEALPRFSVAEVAMVVLLFALFLVGVFYCDTVVAALGFLIWGPLLVLFVYNVLTRTEKRKLIFLSVLDFVDMVRFVVMALPIRIALRVFNRLRTG